MYRFVLSRRWLGFALFVVVLATVCVRLGFWQLDRLHERIDQNALVKENMAAPAATIGHVDSVSGDRRAEEEWRTVRVRGHYDVDHQVVVKYQTRDSQPGVEVVTPLVTESGRAVLVDRGWMKSANNTDSVTDIPDPPSGTVAVTGWWRPDSQADDHVIEPEDGQVRAISSAGVASAVDYELFSGYLNLDKQVPTGSGGLEGEPMPDEGQGPHFFYAMQWYFFAALAVFGWFYFAWIEAHPNRKSTRRTTSRQAPAGSSGRQLARADRQDVRR